MGKVERFEDIQAWQKARELNKEKDFSLRDQMRRASISVMANIAEGFGRRSKKEFINFLNKYGSWFSCRSSMSFMWCIRPELYKPERF